MHEDEVGFGRCVAAERVEPIPLNTLNAQAVYLLRNSCSIHNSRIKSTNANFSNDAEDTIYHASLLAPSARKWFLHSALVYNNLVRRAL